MVNEESLKRIEQLGKEYERVWGKTVDYSVLPPGLTQEKLVPILERIVETGESVLVGWNYIYDRH